MSTRNSIRAARCIASVLGAFSFASSMPVHAQSWRPQKNVEVVVSTSPGGAVDANARIVQRIIQERRLIGVSSSVVNKPGGAGTIAYLYLNQHAGDAHYLGISSVPLLTNHITGTSTLMYSDFTPIAQLVEEYMAFAVRPDSPIKTGKDLLERLRNDPASVSFAIAPALGNALHIAAGLVMKAAGGETRMMKVVVFNSGGEAMSALLGGHVDVYPATAGSVVPMVQSAKVRVIGVSSPQRLSGVLAGLPTWKEQGVDAVYAVWRGLMGPKGLSAAQVAYWDEVVAKVARSDDWRKELETNFWNDHYLPSAEARKYLDDQYQRSRAVLRELGLAKQ